MESAKFVQLLKDIGAATKALGDYVEQPELIETFEQYSDLAEDGNSLLDLKIHLLLQYLSNLTACGLQKLTPPYSLKDCQEQILATAKIRTVIEKIRPIEGKLKYQLEKLMKAGSVGNLGSADPLNYKPNPAAMGGGGQASDSDSSATELSDNEQPSSSTTGKYVPPKLTSMQYCDTTRVAEKDREEKRRKSAISKGILQDLREEFGEEPVEVRQIGHELGDRARRKFMNKQQEKAHYEEEHMVRLNKTKKERSMEKRAEKIFGAGEFSALSDFREFESFMDRGSSSTKRKKGAAKGKKRKRIKM